MLATIRSATLLGVEGRPIFVEVHLSDASLPGFQMVGLPDEVCRGAYARARAAVLSSRLVWPNVRITVNLAPSDQRKVGSALDLPIALGVLVAAEVIPPAAVDGLAFVGELGLDGSLRPVAGIAPLVAALRPVTPVVPVASAREAHGVVGEAMRVASSLHELVGILVGGEPWPRIPDDVWDVEEPVVPDLSDVRGQAAARAGLEIAAAGGHHMLLVGPPGSGKTMLAQRLPGLLPALDAETSLEATMVHSAAGVRLPSGGLVRHAPFRAPHHSSSMVSLVGGGNTFMRPGEASLAHGGVLFLDEMGEFAPQALDALRQPLEEGAIRVARARAHTTLPARFLLIGATNPCPCGGGAPGSCECDEGARQRYLRRLSGPLLDRFDLRVGVHRPTVDELVSPGGGEPTAAVRHRVLAARALAVGRSGMLNAQIPAADLDTLAPVDTGAAALLRAQLEADLLTGRGYHRVRRVARTVADLAGAEVVGEEHVAAALQLRVRLGVSRRAA